jgi:hypothetical protein
MAHTAPLLYRGMVRNAAPMPPVVPVRHRRCREGGGRTSKAVFVSRGEAKALTRHGRRTDGVKPYRCRWCGGWHLGHARRRR